MPITYTVDEEKRCVYTRAHGVITATTWRQHIKRLGGDLRVPVPLVELWDGTGIESFPLTATEMRDIADLAHCFQDKFGDAHVAIVSPHLFTTKMGQASRVLLAGSPYQVQTFRSLRRAEAWVQRILEEQLPPRSFRVPLCAE